MVTERPYPGHPAEALTDGDPWRPVEVEIVGQRRETADTTTYTFAFRDAEVRRRYTFRPGQFNMLGLYGIGEAPLSLSSDPGLAGSFQHTVRSLGDVTVALARLQVGDVVGVRGPFGNPWPMAEAASRDLLIVGGGTGFAPLRSAIAAALRERSRYGQITILYGARTPGDLLFTADFDRWAAQPDVRLLLTVDRSAGGPWGGHVGVVPTLFEGLRLWPDRTVALVCGPDVMMRFVVVELLKLGFPPERIFLSLERRMRCGVAQCGHCFLGPKFVCMDGPVFRYPQLYGLSVRGA